MLQKLLYGHQDDTQTNYDAVRYSFMLTAVAIVHFIFMVIFYIMGVTVMGVYNTATVIMYVYLSRVVSNIKLWGRLFYTMLAEVVIHSCLSTLFVGWDFGFMFYLVSLIPVSFYLTFSITALKRKLVYPFVTSGIVFAAYMIMRGITYGIEPLAGKMLFVPEVFLYYMNLIIGLGTTFLFSALFAVEVNSMQLKMESEQERLEDEASYDPLTHFLNRRKWVRGS